MQDIELSLSVPDSKMTAYLSFAPTSKNMKVTIDEVKQYLAENNILFGVDDDKLKNVISNLNLIKKPIASVLVAKGKKPGLGNNDNVFFDYLNSATIESQYENEQKFFDENDFDLPENIKEGDKILTILRKTETFSGQNVYNEMLPPAEGEYINLKPLHGIKTDQEELNYYADLTGQVVFTPEGVCVLPVKEVSANIDKQYGDIDYEGNVMVRGSIMDGRKVKAKGNIIVYGTVCDADVRAGGNIKIKSQILGKRQAVVMAGGDVLFGGSQNAYIEAKRNILSAESIANSELVAEKAVYIQKSISSNTRIYARKFVWGQRLGSNIARNVQLTCGYSLAVSKPLIEKGRQIQKYKTQLIQVNDQLKQVMGTYGSLNNVPDKFKAQVQNSYQNLQKLKTAIQTLGRERQEILAKQTHDTSPQVECGEIYPGVVIQFYDHIYKSDLQRNNVNIFLNETGDIDIRSIEEARLAEAEES